MKSAIATLPVLLRGESAPLTDWLDRLDTQRTLAWVLATVTGSALYGAAMGWWQAPLQGAYAAIKFPLVILLTTLGNALLNAMLAPLLGLDMSLRQSLTAMLMSFTIAATLLAGFSPLLAFVVWNSPPIHLERSVSFLTYQFTQLAVVSGIAFAGIAANVRLFGLLAARAGSRRTALKVLFSWLAANLFLGSQISWILRPFVGLPHVPPMFLLPEPFQGSFYENVFEAIRAILTGESTIGS